MNLMFSVDASLLCHICAIDRSGSQILEDIMNTLQTSLSLSAVALVGSLLAMPLLTSTANASVTSQLMNCQFNSKQKSIDCCQKILRTQNKPIWMINAGGSCSSVVKCVGGGGAKGPLAVTYVRAPKRCVVYIPNDNGNDGGRQHDTPQRPGRPTFNRVLG
jgi:hypothetical protein